MKNKFLKTFSVLFSIFTLSLVGCNNENNSNSQISEKLEHGITFTGVEDKTINLYEEFDLLDGVKAIDNVDGELEVTVVDDDSFTNDFIGSYTIVYSATNSIGQEKTIERSIAVSKGVNVQNGNFSYGKAYWAFDQPGGQAKIDFKEKSATITATSTGSEAWSLQLYQTNVAFEANKTYELSFKVKSKSGRSISAGFENVANNYSMLVNGYQAITLQPNADYVTYSVLCTPSSPVSNVKAVIYVGRNLDIDMTAAKDNPLDVTIDDINVKEISIDVANAPVFENANNVSVKSKDEFDAYEPVKAYDKNGKDISDRMEIIGEVPTSVSAKTGMMLSYRVSDEEGNFNYVNRRIDYSIAKDNPWNLINEKFDNGSQGWVADVNQTNGTAQASFVASNGEMNIDIANGSNTDWHIQLHQSNITLTANMELFRAMLCIWL